SGAPGDLPRDQREPGAYGSRKRDGADGQKLGSEVCDFDRRASDQASRYQHAVWRDHRAARLAGNCRRFERAAARRIRESNSQIMKIVSSVEKYRCDLFWVSEERAVDRSGFEIHRSIVHHRGSAVMMPVDERKRILLVRQYRLPARQYLW